MVIESCVFRRWVTKKSESHRPPRQWVAKKEVSGVGGWTVSKKSHYHYSPTPHKIEVQSLTPKTLSTTFSAVRPYILVGMPRRDKRDNAKFVYVDPPPAGDFAIVRDAGGVSGLSLAYEMFSPVRRCRTTRTSRRSRPHTPI